MKQLGQYAAPRHAIAHLSDPHLITGGGLHYGVVDNAANLRRAIERLAAVRPAPQAIVFTGDLADQAAPDAYATLRSIVEPAAAEMGAIVVWTMGNHDEREPFARGLYDSDDAGFQDRVHEVDGLRIVALDTSVPGWHHGDLGPDQLDWLRDVLSEPAPHGTILAMHHPPMPSHIPLFDILELRHQDDLARVIHGSDVRAILAGHLHYSSHGMFAGVPVSVASATCYTMNVARPAVEVNGMDAAQAFQLVHVYPETITHTVVPVVEAPTADFFTREWAERMAYLTPEQRLDVFSRKPGWEAS